MLFTHDTHPRRRWSPFAGSGLLHCALISLLTLQSVKSPGTVARPISRRYAVHFLRLQMPPTNPAPSVSRSGGAPAKPAGESARAQSSSSGLAQPITSSSSNVIARGAPEQTVEQRRRPFELAPNIHVNPVKQTLVQLDLPPDILLKQEIPLPTLLLWREPLPVPIKKPFVSPPVKQVTKLAQNFPAAPALDIPKEPSLADLKISALALNDNPRLVRAPASTSPIRITHAETAHAVPEISLPEAPEIATAAVISLPASPSNLGAVVVLPPARQIAPSEASGSAASAGGEGAGKGAGRGMGGADQGLGASIAGGGAAGSRGDATGSGGASKVLSGSGAVAASNGANDSGPGVGRSGVAGSGRGSGGDATGDSSAGGSARAPGLAIPGVTRLTLPEDGKFGVIVVGSAAAAPYPESVGALGGKMVYTVYLRVGLRKSWILQYCLLKNAEQRTATKGSATPVDAPWPFLILRPDRLANSDSDYVVVHGMITSEGRFDQLSLVFPEDLEAKTLLLKSLNEWAFRPASRDGQPIQVEILLIIPRETD